MVHKITVCSVIFTFVAALADLEIMFDASNTLTAVGMMSSESFLYQTLSIESRFSVLFLSFFYQARVKIGLPWQQLRSLVTQTYTK